MHATLEIKLRHLDTGEESIETHELPAVTERKAQRFQVEQLLAKLHPEAKPRTYHDGVGTFLSREHLIIVGYDYDGHRAGAKSRPVPAATDQPALFAP